MLLRERIRSMLKLPVPEYATVGLIRCKAAFSSFKLSLAYRVVFRTSLDRILLTR